MAVTRQANLLGQQRIDIPHLRGIEAGVAGDFDVLAGQMLAGGEPLTIKGFTVVTTGAIGNDSSSLVVDVADSSVIHYNSSESGSIFEVPSDREQETLSTTNTRVQGSFTPSTVNYVGIDLVRSADDTTADTVQFINAATNEETPLEVALARTLDYKFVISTTEFSSTPGVLPIAKITTDASNKVTVIEDARQLMFRLGAGGSSPSGLSSFSWPGGRDESSTTLGASAGDRSIFSFKEWLNAIMSRLWEVGGGEYWYSNTSDKNVRMGTSGTTFTNGEHFEWDGTDLHWRGVQFVFENSNGYINEVANQLGDSVGLTDLADGECIYVDLDRTQNRTSGLGNQLVAQKASYQTLGSSSPVGQRWIIAWRTGANIMVRDRPFPVNFSFVISTASSHGTTRQSANSTFIFGQSYAATINNLTNGRITAGGISHHKTQATAHNISVDEDITIGLGEAEGDQNIVLTATGVYNIQNWGYAPVANLTPAVELRQNGPLVGTASPEQRIVEFNGDDGEGSGVRTAGYVESGGAIALRNTPKTPVDPVAAGSDLPRAKMFMRVDKVFTTVRVATTGSLPTNIAAGSGVGKTLTADANGALTVDTIAVAVNDLVLVKDEATDSDNGVYIVTHAGDGGNPYILTRATGFDQDNEWEQNTAFFISEGSQNGGEYWKNTSVYPLTVDTDDISVVQTSNMKKDQFCIIWHDGSISVIDESPAYV